MCNTSFQSPQFPQRHETSGLESINTDAPINNCANIIVQYINHMTLNTHYCTISSHPLLIVSSLPSALTLSVHLSVSLPPPCFTHILFTLNLPSIQTPSLVPISFLLPVFNVLSHTNIHNITNNKLNCAQRINLLK